MSVFTQMLQTQALMFVFMAAGFLLDRTGALKKEGRSGLIGLLFYVTLPCMILHAFLQEVSWEDLLMAGQAVLISAVCCVGAYGLSFLLWRREPPERRSTLTFATMFSNAGNAGLPVVALVFGSRGVFFASFFLLPVRILMWTLGLSLFVAGNGRAKWRSLLLNPSLIVVFIGLALMFLPVRLPTVLDNAVESLGNMTGPLSMILIGAALAGQKLRDILDAGVWRLVPVRLIAIPLAALAVMRWLGVDTLLMNVAVTLLAMPAASNTAMIAEMYGRDYRFASACVFVTTILSLATVPCLTLLY